MASVSESLGEVRALFLLTFRYAPEPTGRGKQRDLAPAQRPESLDGHPVRRISGSVASRAGSQAWRRMARTAVS
jgi:hypothetical protein